MNYNETADKILHAVGGAENIRMLTHCATRLRMEFNDRAKVNDAQIGTLPGVISVVEEGRMTRYLSDSTLRDMLLERFQTPRNANAFSLLSFVRKSIKKK